MGSDWTNIIIAVSTTLTAILAFWDRIKERLFPIQVDLHVDYHSDKERSDKRENLLAAVVRNIGKSPIELSEVRLKGNCRHPKFGVISLWGFWKHNKLKPRFAWQNWQVARKMESAIFHSVVGKGECLYPRSRKKHNLWVDPNNSIGFTPMLVVEGENLDPQGVETLRDNIVEYGKMGHAIYAEVSIRGRRRRIRSKKLRLRRLSSGDAWFWC